MVEPNTDRIVPRRRALLLAGVGLGSLGLVACGGAGNAEGRLGKIIAVPVLLQRHLRTAVVLVPLPLGRPLIPLTLVFQKGIPVVRKPRKGNM